MARLHFDLPLLYLQGSHWVESRWSSSPTLLQKRQKISVNIAQARTEIRKDGLRATKAANFIALYVRGRLFHLPCSILLIGVIAKDYRI